MPHRSCPLCNFYEICSVCRSFPDPLAVKIWIDLLKGLWMYWGFQVEGVPQMSKFAQSHSFPTMESDTVKGFK